MDFSKMDRSQITVAASGFSVMLTLHFTFQLMSQHMFYWKNPKEQKAIITIIIMVPLYGIVSFVGLLDISGTKQLFMFLNSVKECYEALVIAKFLSLMYSYLNISMGDKGVPDEIKGREIRHLFPVSLFLPQKTHLNHGTLQTLKNLTWQFVIVRSLCSISMLALQMLGMYPSWLKWPFTALLSLSSSIAVYSLIVFYRIFAKDLEPHKPLAKFICITGIVFFSFWQGILLQILASMGIIGSQHFWLESEHVEKAIQNVLICVEMVVFSVIQQYAYHVSAYSGEIESRLMMQTRD